MTENKRLEIDKKMMMECFDIVDGELLWKERPLSHFKNQRTRLRINNMYSGQPAGSIFKPKKSKTEYIRVCVNRKYILAHNIVAVLSGIALIDGFVIDHIDGNGMNNNPSNLRLISSNQNHRNRPLVSNNKSGVCGVYFETKAGKWAAKTTSNNGVRVFLGYFSSIKSAADAVLASREMHKFHNNHGR